MHRSILRPHHIAGLFVLFALLSIACVPAGDNPAGPEPEAQTGRIIADIGVATFTPPVWDPAWSNPKTTRSAATWAPPMALPQGVEHIMETTPYGSTAISWFENYRRGAHDKFFGEVVVGWAHDGIAPQAMISGAGPDGDMSYVHTTVDLFPTMNYNPENSYLFVDGDFSVEGGEGWCSEGYALMVLERQDNWVGTKNMGCSLRHPSIYDPYATAFALPNGQRSFRGRLFSTIASAWYPSMTRAVPDRLRCYIYARLSPGPGVVTATVDRYGLILFPALTITSPTNRAEYVLGDPVPLSGEISGIDNPRWFCATIGNAGTGLNPEAIQLPLGEHVIVFSGDRSTTVGRGELVSESVTVTIKPPSLEITSPKNNEVFDVGTLVHFAGKKVGTVNDIEWEDLKPDGTTANLATGLGSFDKTDLMPGTHTITLKGVAGAIEVADSVQIGIRQDYQLKILEISFLSGNEPDYPPPPPHGAIKVVPRGIRAQIGSDNTATGNRNSLYDRANHRSLEPPHYLIEYQESDPSIVIQETGSASVSFVRSGAQFLSGGVSTATLRVKIKNFSSHEAVFDLHAVAMIQEPIDFNKKDIRIPASSIKEVFLAAALPDKVGKWEFKLRFLFFRKNTQDYLSPFEEYPKSGFFTLYTTWNKPIPTGHFGRHHPPENIPSYYLEIVNISCSGAQNLQDEYEVIKGIFANTRALGNQGFYWTIRMNKARGIDNLLAHRGRGASCGEYGYLMNALFRSQGIWSEYIFLTPSAKTFNPPLPVGKKQLGYKPFINIPVIGSATTPTDKFNNHAFVLAPSLRNGIRRAIVFDPTFLHPKDNSVQEEYSLWDYELYHERDYEAVFAEKITYSGSGNVDVEINNPPGVNALIERFVEDAR